MYSSYLRILNLITFAMSFLMYNVTYSQVWGDLRMWLSLGGHFLVDHTPQWNFSGSLDLRWSGYPLQSEGQVVVFGLSYHREIKIIIDGPLCILEKHISHLCMPLQSFIENSKATSFKLGSDKKEKFSNKSSQQRMLCCFLNYMIQQIPWCFRCRIGMALESSRRQITVADPQNFGTSLC